MKVTAYLKGVRIAPRKVRLVAGLIKGMDAVDARDYLKHLPKRSSENISKLLESALSNAYNNFGLVKDNMKISDMLVDGGPVLKRYKPKGFGSASPIAKRTSHIKIVLEEKVAGLKAEKKATKEKIETEADLKAEKTEKAEKAEIKKEIGKKSSVVKNIARKFFRRKSI